MIDFSQIEIPGASSSELSGLAAAAAGAPSPDDPKTLRDMILASPHDLAVLKERNPPLADALLSGSLGVYVTCKTQPRRWKLVKTVQITFPSMNTSRHAGNTTTGWSKKFRTLFCMPHNFIKCLPIVELYFKVKIRRKFVIIPLLIDFTTAQMCRYTTLWNVIVLKQDVTDTLYNNWDNKHVSCC